MKHFLYIILLYSLFNPEYLNLSQKQIIEKEKLFKKYSWLNSRLYNLYKCRSIEYKVPLTLALSLINAESKGKNIISKKNKNGTRDYGRMQINSVHKLNNPRKLLNDKINSKYGFWYLSKCFNKSIGNIPYAIRMYNQGLNGKKKHYKNWKYIEKILICLN